MTIKFDVTTVTEDEAIGKTIERITDVFSQAAIRFTDGTYLVIATDHEDASVYMGRDFRWSEWARHDLVKLGVCTGEEFDAKVREERADREASEARVERSEYERLRAKFDEELHTCRAIVGATSEHLHVDLEELVDKLRRTEADSRSWQELATARAQANDRLRSAAQAVLSWLNGEALEQYPSLAAEATHDVEPLRCNLETALAAAPAAQPAPAAPVTDDDAPGGDDGVEPGAPIAHLTCPGCKGALEIVHGDEVGAVSAMWVLDGDTRLTVGRYTAAPLFKVTLEKDEQPKGAEVI